MIVIVSCLIVGVLAALFVPFNFSTQITPYIAIALLAGFDSIFGGIVATLNNNFKLNIFVTGFFGNALLAAIITYIGTLLNVDLSIAAIVVFGTRLFQNFAIIRRFLIDKHNGKFVDKKI